MNDQLREFCEDNNVSLDGRLVEFNAKPPADAAAIARVETDSGIRLPKGYVDFLRMTNGGEGSVGASYVALYSVEVLVERNAGYGFPENEPWFFIFGSDGGGEAFCFDTRSATMRLVMVPFITMDVADAIPVGNDFDDFLNTLHGGRLFEHGERAPGDEDAR